MIEGYEYVYLGLLVIAIPVVLYIAFSTLNGANKL